MLKCLMPLRDGSLAAVIRHHTEAVAAEAAGRGSATCVLRVQENEPPCAGPQPISLDPSKRECEGTTGS